MTQFLIGVTSFRRFAVRASVAAVIVILGAAFPVWATECEMLFYELGTTVPGQAGSSPAQVCEQIKSSIVAQSPRLSSGATASMNETPSQTYCVITTRPGDVPRDLLDVYRHRVGVAVTSVAGSSYTNWSMQCN